MNQHFGHYLLNKGILAQNQLVEVFQRERNVKVKLGVLAVNSGLMTAAQVEEVHHLQRVKDQKFGVLAVEQGYLSSAQVDQLLASQCAGHLSLMQAIADIGFMTLAEVEKALRDFRDEYGITADKTNAAKGENEIIRKAVDFSAAGESADLLYDYVGLVLRNIVRFLNDTPFIIPQNKDRVEVPRWMVSQQIIGDISLRTGLLMEDKVLLEVASRFYGETLSTIDRLSLDCAGEFINVHNGVFGASLSDAGLMVDLEPQWVERESSSATPLDYRVKVGTSFGLLEIVLSLD